MDSKRIFKLIVSRLEKHGIRKIAVFGSYARGNIRPGSDIDLIVEFSERKSLLDIVRIERELFEEVGIKIDLLTEKSISPYLIDNIKREMVVLHK